MATVKIVVKSGPTQLTTAMTYDINSSLNCGWKLRITSMGTSGSDWPSATH